jgi:hypothetical protein
VFSTTESMTQTFANSIFAQRTVVDERRTRRLENVIACAGYSIAFLGLIVLLWRLVRQS